LPRFGRVYAPLEVTEHSTLAHEMRAFLQNADVNGYLVAFLGEVDGDNDGVVVVGDSASSAELLDRCGPALLALTTLAERATTQRRRAAPRLERLTAREREIALLLASGYSKLNVAARLGISEQTVGVHARSIYRKLNLHTRVELANHLRALG
jgi:DNA-binding CsgD family transcriptional regulator